MTTVSVRISQKEKAELRRHGKLSKVVKEAIALYLSLKSSRQALRKLSELQNASKIKTTAAEEVALIHEDRLR